MNHLIVFICLSVGLSQTSPSRASVIQSAEEAIKDEIRNVKDKVVGEWSAVRTEAMDVCRCINYNCGCCAHLEEKDIHLNSTICVNVSYLVHDYGISFTVTVNDYTLYNETVSARNPPPVCIGVPYVKEYADACIRLYDINATTTYLHACIRVEARMKTVVIAKYELGCFNIGPPGLSSGVRITKTREQTSEASNAVDMTTASEDKQTKLQDHQTSEASNAVSVTTASEDKQTKLQDHQTSEGSNAVNVTTASEDKQTKLQDHQTSEANNAVNMTTTSEDKQTKLQDHQTSEASNVVSVTTASEDKQTKLQDHQTTEGSDAVNTTSASEDKQTKLQDHQTSEGSDVVNTTPASEDRQANHQEHQTSVRSDAAGMTAPVVGVVTGLIVVMALSAFGVIALARRRGNSYFARLFGNRHHYSSLESASHVGNPRC